MNIKFYKLTMHNFLSYGHSELDFTNKGFCLVSGINKCPKDNALSNGAGKSTWISAICWCLTGETIQGITNGLKNIYIDENECWVTLEFKVNSDIYKVTREYKPSSNLKIIINNEDKSGKTFRESEAILYSSLPDLTKNLLAYTILLGQGLPDKFTNNTPSGRKEVLEKLSKSDFMIQDIKDRLLKRQEILCNEERTIEDNILISKTNYTSLQTQLETLNKEVNELSTSSSYDTQLIELENILTNIDTNKSNIQNKLLKDQEEQNTLQQQLIKNNSELNTQKIKIDDEYQSQRKSIDEEYNELKVKKNTISLEIEKLDSIQDVCPTCGRPFEGITKPDTSALKEELQSLNTNLQQYTEKYNNLEVYYQNNVLTLKQKYNTDTVQQDLQLLTKTIKDNTALLEQLNNDYTKVTSNIVTIKSLKQTYVEKLKELKEKIAHINTDIITNETTTKRLNEDLLMKQYHLGIIRQMDTLVKRDFRGYLLTNVIDYIDSRCKDYCEDIFGTRALDFKLDGNNIDISYCSKTFASLSGGEQQRVNLIIQFAIRDMLKQYLDFSSNILVLDEIFDGLDALSTTKVIDLIANKFDDVESVFIISHHSESLDIPYDSELIVEKNELGISSLK